LATVEAKISGTLVLRVEASPWRDPAKKPFLQASALGLKASPGTAKCVETRLRNAPLRNFPVFARAEFPQTLDFIGRKHNKHSGRLSA